jgi:hypothetical protein
MPKTRGPRDCERQCRTCKDWKHHSRFHTRPRPNRSVGAIEFDLDCRDCQQIKRNEEKNKDRPLAILKSRAADRAARAGVSPTFFWINMNYRALLPVFRSLTAKDALCPNCGHAFLNERDIQIEHRAPPRHPKDWARLHARNLGFFCHSCNGTKGNKPYDPWLDEQEAARLSNEHHRRMAPPIALPEPSQLSFLS